MRSTRVSCRIHCKEQWKAMSDLPHTAASWFSGPDRIRPHAEEPRARARRLEA
jgi:hypothetical protein